jgi:hypothetical protein
MTERTKYYCVMDDCKTRAYYNYSNREYPEYCEDDKKEDMADFRYGICRYINDNNIQCNIRATYGKIGTKNASYCYSCYNKLDDEIKKTIENVVSKKCIKCEKKRPTFNKPGETTASHCGDCKEEGMINIVSKRCIKCEKKQPNFNKPGETLATHCGDCKEDGMIDIKNKRCIKCQKKQPTFNKPGETIATHCGDCKEDGMINVLEKRKCIKCEKKRPTFNKPGKTQATHCGDCKEEGMIDIVSKKCIKCKKKQPLFNKPGETVATHCGDCKEDDMIDIKNKKCISPMCDIRANSKYKGYCFRCFVYNYPEEPNSRNYKTTERAVVDYITDTFKDYKILNDKTISGGCSKRRPDILIDVETHCIIIEIDENLHINYSCENKRMMEISQDLGHPNIVFIRFNPDAYINNEGKKIKSCWKVNKSGICVIDSKNKWKERLDNLKNLIEYWLNNIPKNI